MASIIDTLMAREGTLDPDLIGIHQARAGDSEWYRDRGESEHDFLARIIRDASAAGFRIVQIAGALQVDNIVELRRPMPPDAA